MSFIRSIAVISFCVAGTSFCFASTDAKPAAAAVISTAPTGPVVPYSSSSLPDAPSAVSTSAISNVDAGASGGTRAVGMVSTRPFSAVALGVKVGVEGIGFEVATPLARKLNLRGSASFFNYNPNLTEDGINVTGALKFKTVNASLDFYPFGGSFRISPGVTMYNGNRLAGIATIPGGQTFTLNDTDYTSSPADPVKGTFNVSFGKQVAPSLTMGFGNMLPRRVGQHWSVPFEVGFEYIGRPLIALSLSGTACQNGIDCGPIATDPSTQANVQQEQNELNDDIAGLRFYPIVSLGVAYKFSFGGAR